MTGNTDRVVLAYSGGLDTSVAIGWLAEQTGAEVVAVAVDVGQGGDALAERLLRLAEHHREPGREPGREPDDEHARTHATKETP